MDKTKNIENNQTVEILDETASLSYEHITNQ